MTQNFEHYQAIERKRIDNLSEQFADLKTAILTSIGSSNERDVARGVVRYRKLLDFVKGLALRDIKFVFKGKPSWDELLHEADITELVDVTDNPEFQIQRRHIGPRGGLFLVKNDRTYYEMRVSPEFFHNLSLEWESFVELAEDTREVIFDALSEMRIGPGPIRYVRKSIEETLDELHYKHQRHLLEDELSDDEDNA
jgi:hypothetical protein